jgi:hypothetical protein
MPMPMAVRFRSFPALVCMLMVSVVHMHVLVFYFFVLMLQFHLIMHRPRNQSGDRGD